MNERFFLKILLVLFCGLIAAYAIIKDKFGEAVSAFDANETMPFFEVIFISSAVCNIERVVF